MLNIHVHLPSDCLTTPSDPYFSTLDCFAPRAPAARSWRKQGSPVRAHDRAVFDNSAPTTRGMAATSVGLSQRIASGLLRTFSRSGSSGEVQELSSHLYQGTGSGRRGVSQLSPAVFPLARQM